MAARHPGLPQTKMLRALSRRGENCEGTETKDLRLKLTGSKIMKKWNIVGMAAACGIAAITFHAYAADKLKIGFIYVGPIGDLGWSYQHDLGRKQIEKELG